MKVPSTNARDEGGRGSEVDRESRPEGVTSTNIIKKFELFLFPQANESRSTVSRDCGAAAVSPPRTSADIGGTMSSARGATRRVARLCVSYADAPRLYPRNGVGFAGATIGTRPRFFAQSAVADIDEIGPVTLDFGKLVRPGETPSVAYARLAKEGVLRHDDTQRDAVFVLDDLHRKLVGGHDGDKDKNGKSSSGQSPPQKEGSWFADLFTSTDKPPAPPIPHSGGVYLHGGPGCAKSFVMDLAYACLPGRHGVEKKREHFHSFMLRYVLRVSQIQAHCLPTQD